MKLGIKMHYTLAALVDIYLHCKDTPIKLTDVAQRQNIPLPYLSKIFHRLRRANIVKSTAGIKGGYSPLASAESVSLYQIANILEEKIQAKFCEKELPCPTEGIPGCETPCLSHYIWNDFQGKLNTYMQKTSLADLIKNLPPPLKHSLSN